MNNISIKQINAVPKLTREQELELIKRMLAGDLEARNRLIECNLRYVYIIARKMKSKIPLDDLIEAGTEGLIKAADKFEGSENVRFMTYAVKWINGSILNRINEIQKEQAVEDITAAETIPYAFPEAEVSITALLKPLTDIEREVLNYHYGLNGNPKLTYAQIGKKLNFSADAVRRIEEKAKLKLNPKRALNIKDLPVEIKVQFGVDLSKEIKDLKKTALLNLYGSDLWKSIPDVIQELKDGIKISQSCEYLQKEVRRHLKGGLDTLPEYAQNLMRQWKAYIKNPDVENEQKLNKLIKSIRRYSTKLVEPPMGTAGTLRRFLNSFEKRYNNYTIEDFEKLANAKFRYRGQRFVRTEMAKIYNNLYVKCCNKSENVKGYIFKMSDVHKIDCRCESMNNTFITKEEAFNLIPIHCNCQCYLIEVMMTLEELEKIKKGE